MPDYKALFIDSSHMRVENGVECPAPPNDPVASLMSRKKIRVALMFLNDWSNIGAVDVPCYSFDQSTPCSSVNDCLCESSCVSIYINLFLSCRGSVPKISSPRHPLPFYGYYYRSPVDFLTLYLISRLSSRLALLMRNNCKKIWNTLNFPYLIYTQCTTLHRIHSS